jgi:NAD(P)-dependent dehydrogenase (short-subunit alcohol dehydrogenase family)
MNLGFGDRHVAVTGGSGALGSAVCGLLLEAGAIVHVPVFDATELGRFAHRLHERIRKAEGVDLRDEKAGGGFYARFGDGAGRDRLWASIHIAGGFAMGPITETSAADAHRLMDMNAMTCFLCCREAVRAMGKAGGRIVNVAAKPGVAPENGANMVAYSASKAAVAAITVALAAEVAPRSIWVNAVVPSIMDTPANRASMPKADHDAWPKVEEVAATIAFLASPENVVTRGGLVPVYGKS